MSTTPLSYGLYGKRIVEAKGRRSECEIKINNNNNKIKKKDDVMIESKDSNWQLIPKNSLSLSDVSLREDRLQSNRICSRRNGVVRLQVILDCKNAKKKKMKRN